jgi:hypothetical protein
MEYLNEFKKFYRAIFFKKLNNLIIHNTKNGSTEFF